MGALETEIAAYEKMQRQLEIDHAGKWVVVRGADLVSVHGSFDAAAQDAVQRFGRGPYLIRQVGAPPVRLPASAIFGQAAFERQAHLESLAAANSPHAKADQDFVDAVSVWKFE